MVRIIIYSNLPFHENTDSETLVIRYRVDFHAFIERFLCFISKVGVLVFKRKFFASRVKQIAVVVERKL